MDVNHITIGSPQNWNKQREGILNIYVRKAILMPPISEKSSLGKL